MVILALQKKFSIDFSKANTKLCLSLHYNGDNSYLSVNGKETYKFKADNKNVDFPTQLCLGSISNKFGPIDSREVVLEGNLYNFSVDYNTIDNSYILNFQKYFMVKKTYKMFGKNKCLFKNFDQIINF